MSYEKPEAVSCKYGAPMGRDTWDHSGGDPVRCKLSRMPLDSGGYDAGGAYWGTPNNLYWLRDKNNLTSAFYRANSRKEAGEKALADYPNIVFQRRLA